MKDERGSGIELFNHHSTPVRLVFSNLWQAAARPGTPDVCFYWGRLLIVSQAWRDNERGQRSVTLGKEEVLAIGPRDFWKHPRRQEELPRLVQFPAVLAAPMFAVLDVLSRVSKQMGMVDVFHLVNATGVINAQETKIGRAWIASFHNVGQPHTDLRRLFTAAWREAEKCAKEVTNGTTTPK